jgi:D-arabinose 1-dehydrogenase-like Zn-dependent alcohol dehydrogenase
MKAWTVKTPGEPLVAEERELPEPATGEVRVRVHACGVCHSDLLVTQGLWPGIDYPRVPGHEVAGVVDALGEGVSGFAVGDRVGLGWHGGHDGTCGACSAGRFKDCTNAGVTGITMDGGYAEYVVAPAVALARVPEGMPFSVAAPILCAGVTTFNSLRNCGARSGDLVAVQGLGGLGHLGVQYARAMGFEVVALSRGAEKEPFARDLGAHHYVDTNEEGFAERIQALGGARVVLATAPNAKAIAATLPALGLEGTLLLVAGALEPIEVSAFALIPGDRRIQGWASGTGDDSTDALAFSKLHGIEPMIERFPLDEAQQALEHMASGKARFRAVIEAVPQ